MNPRLWLAAILWLLCAGQAWSQDVLHHGPSLDIQVQRGEWRLPLTLVNHLQRGDKLLVRPDSDTLAKGDWVLLLARVSPTGNQVASQHFAVSDLKDDASLEITADNQVPVIMLAPQLRNMFGLYTSLSESANLLNEVLRADPQRFYDLQKVDQINQAIQAISQGLARRVSGRQSDEAIQVAKDLAAKFGVTSLDPECFRNQVVNTECVATNIVANKDFALPSASDLSAMVGDKKAVDLNSFLLSNLHMFSEASDFLSNKYRDTYDFAPTFGRRQRQTSKIELFSIARFRNGNVKTAYLYVPSWFSGSVPAVAPQASVGCYSSGQLDVRIQGRLPLMSYWHDWHMTVRDPDTQEVLADISDLSLDQDMARIRFTPATWPLDKRLASLQVSVTLNGRFGFDAVTLKPVRMSLPLPDAVTAANYLQGRSTLIAGERAALNMRSASVAACVTDMRLALPSGAPWHSTAGTPTQLQADLQQVEPGDATLTLQQAGADDLVLPVRVQPPLARVTRVEHAQWEPDLTVTGERLDRLARIEVGGVACESDLPIEQLRNKTSIQMMCQGDVQDNSILPNEVTMVYRDNAPSARQVPLTKAAAKPRVDIPAAMPNALLVSPSPKALQWGIGASDRFMTDDSGLSLLLQARSPYTLAKGNYVLQLRFKDDPQSDAHPLNASLIADFAHNELRTRAPVSFRELDLPSVVNPLEFRVQHKPSGLSSDWQPLQRSVLLLPELQDVSCTPSGDALWVAGKHMDLIDGIRVGKMNPASTENFSPATLEACPTGLCLKLPRQLPDDRLQARLRWVDDRVFAVQLRKTDSACGKKPSGAGLNQY